MGLFDDLDIGNEKLPGKKPAGKSADYVKGFIISVDTQIAIIDHFLKHKEWPKTDRGRNERTWFAETAPGSDVWALRVLQGVASPVDLKMKQETLDRDHIAAIHVKMCKDNSYATLLDSYNTVAEPTIKNLKGLKAVKSVLERLKTAASGELRPFINESAFYAPRRGRKAKE